MQTSPVMDCQSSESAAEFPALPLPTHCAATPPAAIKPASSAPDLEIRRAIRDLLDVLPKDVLDELNSGTIDYKDPAFLDGLMDHVSRLSLASSQEGRKALGKIIKLKKLITRNLRESDPDLAVSATITRSGTRVGRNDACPCGSGKKYKQCCLRKNHWPRPNLVPVRHNLGLFRRFAGSSLLPANENIGNWEARTH